MTRETISTSAARAAKAQEARKACRVMAAVGGVLRAIRGPFRFTRPFLLLSPGVGGP
jgi:hypothetical protein